MALDIHDKVQIDTSIKLAFPGIDIKEIKQSVQIEVQETTRKRVSIPVLEKIDPCALALVVPDGGKPVVPDGMEIVLVVVKMAKLDANKGVLPVLVSNKTFIPVQPEESFKLEGEGTVAFWKPAGDKFKIVSNANPVFVYNPNKVEVILDIHYGISKPTPKPPAAGKDSGKGDTKPSAS